MVDDDKSAKPGTPSAPARAIANPSPPPLSRSQQFNAVLEAVKTKHDMPSELILGKQRMWYIVDAKNELAYELRKRYGWGLKIIAHFCKAKDHTVVRHRIVQHAVHNKVKLPDGVKLGTHKRTSRRRLKQSANKPRDKQGRFK